MSLLSLLSGLVVGSFLNVVIHRGPIIWHLIDEPSPDHRFNFAVPGSHCPKCRSPLKAQDLIPLLSFLYRKGRCHYCGRSISPAYPVVETLGAASALTATHLYGISWEAALVFLCFSTLICLAFIDARTFFLPDALTLPLLFIGLAANLSGRFVPFPEAAIGALAGFILFWLMGTLFIRLAGKDGLGLGDAKLLAALGAWLGWMALPLVVFTASFAALAFLILRHIIRRRPAAHPGEGISAPVPFGPFLAASGAAVMLAPQLCPLCP